MQRYKEKSNYSSKTCVFWVIIIANDQKGEAAGKSD